MKTRRGEWLGVDPHGCRCELPANLRDLPADVQRRVETLADSQADWTLFADADGRMWLVAKLHNNPREAEIVACRVKGKP